MPGESPIMRHSSARRPRSLRVWVKYSGCGLAQRMISAQVISVKGIPSSPAQRILAWMASRKKTGFVATASS